jgi:hypothetical protein
MNDTRRGRRLCQSCQYPLLRLDGFDGTSSRDAPVFGDRVSDSSPILHWGLLWYPCVAAWEGVKSLWGSGQKRSRAAEVAKLKADVLPDEPDAMICPQCLRLAFRDEL